MIECTKHYVSEIIKLLDKKQQLLNITFTDLWDRFTTSIVSCDLNICLTEFWYLANKRDFLPQKKLYFFKLSSYSFKNTVKELDGFTSVTNFVFRTVKSLCSNFIKMPHLIVRVNLASVGFYFAFVLYHVTHLRTEYYPSMETQGIFTTQKEVCKQTNRKRRYLKIRLGMTNKHYWGENVWCLSGALRVI